MPCRPRPLVDRFWLKVDRSGGLYACWPWLGAVSNRNVSRGGKYGTIQTGRRGSPLVKAHRYALVLATGLDPDDLEACHSLECTTSLCCNAWGGHLRWGTRAENIADQITKRGWHRLATTEQLIRAAIERAVREDGYLEQIVEG